MSENWTNTDRAAANALVDEVNSRVRSSVTVTMNGERVTSQYGSAAHVFANGTVSVTVRGRRARYGTRYVKVGQSATFVYDEN